jgi:hypothetical protein
MIDYYLIPNHLTADPNDQSARTNSKGIADTE